MPVVAAHAAQHAAAEQPQRVDLMRSLPVDQCRRPARTRVHRRCAAGASSRCTTTRGSRARRRGRPRSRRGASRARRGRSSRVAGKQRHAVFLCRLAHAVGFLEVDRHRLLDMHVLAVAHRFDRVLAMKVVRGRDPDRFDVRILRDRRPYRRYACRDSAPRSLRASCGLMSAPAIRSISGIAAIDGITPPAPCPRPATPMRNGRTLTRARVHGRARTPRAIPRRSRRNANGAAAISSRSPRNSATCRSRAEDRAVRQAPDRG